MIITQSNPILEQFIRADKKAREVANGVRPLPETLTWGDLPHDRKQLVRTLRSYFMCFKS